MTLVACTHCGSPRPRTAHSCPICGSPVRRNQTTSARGYGRVHQRRRKAMLAGAYGTPCPLCGHPLQIDQPLDLDHTVALHHDSASIGDRIVHAHCNRSKGAGVSSKQTTQADDPAKFSRDIARS